MGLVESPGSHAVLNMALGKLDLQQMASRSTEDDKNGRIHLITSPCIYYHYLCDNIDDRVYTNLGIFVLCGGVVKNYDCGSSIDKIRYPEPCLLFIILAYIYVHA